MVAALLALATSLSCIDRTVAFRPGGFFVQTTPKKHATCVSFRTGGPCMSLSPPAPNNNSNKVFVDAARTLATLVVGTTILFTGDAAVADGGTTKFSLPPISQAKDRCTFKSSAMGQANAARDSLYDLRECNLRCVGLWARRRRLITMMYLSMVTVEGLFFGST